MKSFSKLWNMLDAKQRRGALIIFTLTFLGMLFEVLGIGLVIPALALMTDADFIFKHPEFNSLFELFGNPTHEQLIIGGMVALVGVYFIKVLFLSFLVWKQAGFSFGLQAELSKRLFSGYMYKSFVFHLQRNSARLIQNVLIEVTNITNALQQGLLLISEVLVLIGIIILLMVVEPLGTMIVLGILALFGWLIYMFTKARILKWGIARQFHEGLRLQHSQQGLGGVKDIKLLGREDEFLNQFNKHTLGSIQVAQRQFTIQQLPRFWLELLAMMGLAILVVIMIWKGKSVETLLPTVGLFAAAAFRILPSVNRILGAIQNVRYASPAIDTIYNEFELVEENKTLRTKKLLPFNTSLVLTNISYQYPETKSYALINVNLTIPHGTSVGFIGGSGSGKSTLIDIILGLLTPTKGSLNVDGLDIQNNLRGWQDQIGYVPQSVFLTDDTLRRNVALGIDDTEIDDNLVWKAICAAQLECFVNEQPEKIETSVGERGVRLSGGQLQRIGIARALYHDPSILVLDESTSALDSETENGVMDAIRSLQGKKTVIIVAHRLTTIEHCDFLYRLEKGMVVEGGETSDVLKRVSQ